MTEFSQNGFVAGDRTLIETVTVPGTNVQLPVRKGSPGQLLIAAALRWNHEVEPLITPGCWGYAFREIRGSTTELSNHASGTAIDLNAPLHPLGTEPADNFTPAQIAAVRRIVASSRGTLRWGGDFIGRKDGMHLEVTGTEAACTAAITFIMTVPASGGPTPTTPAPTPSEDDVAWLAKDGAPPIHDYYPGATADLPDPATALAWAAANAGNARDAAAAAGAKVDALRADIAAGKLTPTLDYDQLAKALLKQMGQPT